MNIVILGASGFLGSRFAASLARARHQVVAVSRGERPAHLAAPVSHLRASIDDAARLEPVLAAADYVLHLAWDTTPGTSAGQPLLETTLNLLPTMRLIEQLQRHPDCRLVFVSSGGALYRSSESPVDESVPLEPRSCYGAAKAAVELMLHACNAQTGHTVLILRPSNAFGPGQEARRQFAIVPTLMQCARSGAAFEVWGDGTTVRDFVFIGDLERLLQLVIAHRWPPQAFEILNAGCGTGTSINALCAAVESATGRRLQIVHRSARRVDTPYVVLDSSRAKSLLGWSATTPLDVGLRETWNWTTASP